MNKFLRIKDEGDYKCIIKQIKTNSKVSIEEVIFKLKVTREDDFFSSEKF